MTEADWDARYRSAKRVWSGKPNPQLVSEVRSLEPGRALDVGAGEGGDALWLAQRGWQVTALDISSVALARAQTHERELAEPLEHPIRWLHADINQWRAPSDGFDLVTVQFLHLPKTERDPIYRRLAEAVAPGGTLLIVGHHPSDLNRNIKRPQNPDLLFTAEQLASELSRGWTIRVQDTRARATTDTDGDPTTAHDAVLVAERVG